MITRSSRTIGAWGLTSLLFLTACGGEEPPSPQGAGDATTTINFWSWNPDDTTVQPYIEAFEDEHPEIEVEHRFIQYSDYANTTQLALQADSGPDVFGLQVGPLTEQFASLSEDLDPVMTEHLGDDWQDQITAADQLAVEGKQVALPWMVTGGGLMWANQTLVDELGLTVPTTLDELKQFCADVDDAGMVCMVHGGADDWQNVDVYQSIINQLSPGAFYEAVVGEGDFTSTEFIEAFEIWEEFFDEGIFQDGALGVNTYPDANDQFRTGDAALITLGTWQNADTTADRLQQYQETYGDDFDVNTVFMPYDFPQVANEGETGLLFGGPDVGFAVAANSSNMEAANSFVTWMTASESGQSIMAETVQQPALDAVPLDFSDVVTEEQVEALEAQGPALQDMIGQREIDDADVVVALGEALAAVASGQQSPADATVAVQQAIDSAN